MSDENTPDVTEPDTVGEDPTDVDDPATPPDPKYLLPPKVYLWLKWLDLTVLPALITLITSLGAVWHWPWTDAVIVTIGTVATFIGVIIGISQAMRHM